MEFTPLHFLDQPIEALFDQPPDAPPDGFLWDGKTYRVIEMLSSWNDYKRRGDLESHG